MGHSPRVLNDYQVGDSEIPFFSLFIPPLFIFIDHGKVKAQGDFMCLLLRLFYPIDHDNTSMCAVRRVIVRSFDCISKCHRSIIATTSLSCWTWWPESDSSRVGKENSPGNLLHVESRRENVWELSYITTEVFLRYDVWIRWECGSLIRRDGCAFNWNFSWMKFGHTRNERPVFARIGLIPGMFAPREDWTFCLRGERTHERRESSVSTHKNHARVMKSNSIITYHFNPSIPLVYTPWTWRRSRLCLI